MAIEFELTMAKRDQIREIGDLVNMAYRGEKGWTRETELVQGNRVTDSEIESAVCNPDSRLLVAKSGGELVACICIKKEADRAHIGLFAVHPGLQGRGVGKRILAMTENYILREFGIGKFVMTVVSQRPELIAYYERRGYVRVGTVQDYPVHLNVGVPKVAGLTIELLEKTQHRA